MTPLRNKSGRRAARRLLPAWLLACALLVCACAEAGAQARNGNVVLLYDSSGSMGAETARGDRKFAVARAAVHQLFDDLQRENAGHRVSIVAFGHTYPSKREFRDRSCRDIEVLYPHTPVDTQSAAALGRAVERLEPRGYTPISESIRKADAELGPEGGTIVLVTDFEDTCEPSPDAACEALLDVNRKRSPKNVVQIDSIIVPKARDMDTGPVNRLRQCSGAAYMELFSVVDARIRMPEVSRRLVEYARAGGTVGTKPTATLQVVALAQSQGSPSGIRYSAQIRQAGSMRGPLAQFAVPSDPLPLEASVYDVVLLDGEQTVAERTAISLQHGDQTTVYFGITP